VLKSAYKGNPVHKLHKVKSNNRLRDLEHLLPKRLWKRVMANRQEKQGIKHRLLKQDPAGSIASWDWGKNEQGGHFHDRAEDTFLDGRRHGNGMAGNEFGKTQIDNSDDYFKRGGDGKFHGHAGPMAGAF